MPRSDLVVAIGSDKQQALRRRERRQRRENLDDVGVAPMQIFDAHDRRRTFGQPSERFDERRHLIGLRRNVPAANEAPARGSSVARMSRSGPSGRCANSRQAVTATRVVRLGSDRRNCSRSRDLPMPASPATRTAPPRPAAAARRRSARCSSSAARPMNALQRTGCDITRPFAFGPNRGETPTALASWTSLQWRHHGITLQPNPDALPSLFRTCGRVNAGRLRRLGFVSAGRFARRCGIARGAGRRSTNRCTFSAAAPTARIRFRPSPT